MRRWRWILFAALFVLGIVLSVPVWNAWSASQGRADRIVSVFSAPKQITVVGAAAEHMGAELQRYATENGWDLEILPPDLDHEGPRLHEVIFYFGPDMLDGVPGARALCGEACIPEADEVIAFVRLVEMRRFAPRYMAQFINLEAFAIDNKVDGHRFDCVMRAIWDATQDPTDTAVPCEAHATVPRISARTQVAMGWFRWP